MTLKHKKNQKKILLKLVKLLSLATLGTQFAACASTQSADFSVIYENKQCAHTEPELIHISNDKQQAQLIQKLLPFREEADKAELQDLLHTHQNTEHLFLLTQGTRPTPGYGFKMLAEKATIEAATLQLPVQFTRPEAGKMMAQVLTSPCIILGVDKSVRFNRIEADSLQLDISLPE